MGPSSMGSWGVGVLLAAAGTGNAPSMGVGAHAQPKCRKQIGWTQEELYDEHGDARIRTDGGRARVKKMTPAGSSPNQ